MDSGGATTIRAVIRSDCLRAMSVIAIGESCFPEKSVQPLRQARRRRAPDALSLRLS